MTVLQIQVLYQDLGRSLGTCLQEVAQQRAKAWREVVATNLAHNPRRIYAWCKGTIPTVAGAASAAGPVVSPDEVADAVQAHWEKWWNRPQLGRASALEDLHDRARQEDLGKVDGAVLRDIVCKVPPHKAGGPDQWAFSELRLLPLAAFQRLAELLDLVEALGRWPSGLTGASVSMIPKPGAMDATGLRPIGLMPVVYRLWAAARQPFVRQWLRPQEFLILGGRPGVGAELAALEANVIASEALASGEHAAAAFLDVSKAYEGVDHALL
ncbi:MAG: hypothetical protein GY772_04935, partial [bacterium]|nr:hypothetical protein [bacterium]